MKEACRIAILKVAGCFICVVLLLLGHVLPSSAAKKPILVALALGTEEGEVTIVIPEGGTATHRNYAKGLYLGFVPTVTDLAGGDVDIKVFALRDDDSGSPRRVRELGQLSTKLGFRDVVSAVPEMDVTVVAMGDDLRSLAKVTGRQCAKSESPKLLVNANLGGGCCVSCGGSSSCGCAVGGGCGSCCGGCCGWTY